MNNNAQDIIVVVSDKLIIVNGHGLFFDFVMPEGMPASLKALQWHDGKGEIETIVDNVPENIAINTDDYDKYVKLFVDLWEAEKYKLDNPPPPTLAEAKTAKLAEITSERDKREQAGFDYMGKVFDADATSVQRLTLAAQAAGLALQASQPFEITWTVQDNAILTMSATEMLGVVPAIAMHANTLHQEGRRLKELVNKAKSVKAVQAVNWG